MLVALVSEIFVESVQEAAVAFGMSQAFVGFVVVALVGGAAEMGCVFRRTQEPVGSQHRHRPGSASQIVFVAPVLVLVSYFIAPSPMDLRFWPGAVVMMLIATMTAALVTSAFCPLSNWRTCRSGITGSGRL